MYLMNICKRPECRRSVLSDFDDNGNIRENGDFCFMHHPDQEGITKKLIRYIESHDKIVGLNASGVTFSNVDFTDKKFYGCNFCRCFFLGVNAMNMRSRMSIFDYAVFTDCNFLSSNIKFTSLGAAKFIHVLFTGSDLVQDNFSGISAFQSSFDDSDLYNSRFIRANLADTSFRNCNLKKTIFYDVQQTNVSFKQSNTKEAFFDQKGSEAFKGIIEFGGVI
ncbi:MULTISPECIES: pentapeptide repeat-containing protein [Treponema]|uniref:Pentapeptide repeat protein n=1 Tax=Treponema saccharophilum DSM 2985 TaxID=907348 RepID=H7EJ02_9SPIR|nr:MULTISPECIES: pentapeptide repeat-containing protein [Treponema]EIC02459.1 hypothetical protein TresaDRAFT_2101 [Treponema saccharophilum DSM 2985]MBQ5538020.1 pentapeptide repeat-containing protein [Treponema sp.]BDC96639.1 hypothetical protein TRSA_17380 [Treponema saccharophilum]